jgi:hypothetical protein
MDATADFLATASLDGKDCIRGVSHINPIYFNAGHVVVQSLSTSESYAFDMKRPMRTVAMRRVGGNVDAA